MSKILNNLVTVNALQAAEVANAAVRRMQELNRRTLDVLAARVVFYYSWAYEGLGRLAEVRQPERLLAPHRTGAYAPVEQRYCIIGVLSGCFTAMRTSVAGRRYAKHAVQNNLRLSATPLPAPGRRRPARLCWLYLLQHS